MEDFIKFHIFPCFSVSFSFLSNHQPIIIPNYTRPLTTFFFLFFFFFINIYFNRHFDVALSPAFLLILVKLLISSTESRKLELWRGVKRGGKKGPGEKGVGRPIFKVRECSRGSLTRKTKTMTNMAQN